MQLALHFKAKELTTHSNSQLVVDQFNGQFEAREENMASYLGKYGFILNQSAE